MLRAVFRTRVCTPGMGVNLRGESPLSANPVNGKNISKSIGRRQPSLQRLFRSRGRLETSCESQWGEHHGGYHPAEGPNAKDRGTRLEHWYPMEPNRKSNQSRYGNSCFWRSTAVAVSSEKKF